MRTVLSSQGRLVLPAAFRKQDGIQPGDQFDVERLAEGEYLLRRIFPEAGSGIIDWLLACPEKDWFRPIPSEQTDTIV